MRGRTFEAKTNRDLTPLHHAAGFNDNPAVVQALVDAGADIEAGTGDVGTPLHSAARTNETEVVQALVDAGADIEARTGNVGLTPLHHAAAIQREPGGGTDAAGCWGRPQCEG